MTSKLNSKGFAAIELLLSLILVVLVVFVGYYVYHSQKTANNTLNSANKISQDSSVTSKKSGSASTTYFTIKEWGVRAPYSGNLKITYSMSRDASQTNTLLFNSSQLVAAGCTENGIGSGGIVTRYAPSDHVYAEDGLDLGTASDFFASNDNSGLNKFSHVGNYYYQYTHPQSACGDTSTYDIQNQTDNTVSDIVKNLHSIPS